MTKKELVKIIIDNFTRVSGDTKYLDLDNLDFSDFNGDVYMERTKTKKSLYRGFADVRGGVLDQSECECVGNINQGSQFAKGNLIQSDSKAKNIIQSRQEANENIEQDHSSAGENIFQGRNTAKTISCLKLKAEKIRIEKQGEN